MKHIGILGIGRLGLCFALNLEQSGYRVTGIDVNKNYVEQLNSKTFFSHEPGVNQLLKTAKNFSASNQIADVIVDAIEVLFVMVATPTAPNGGYDHTQVEKVVAELVKQGKRNKVVDLVIGCTVMPGYCNQLAEKLAPLNYEVSYNPEFIAQGNIIHNQQHPDQILIGEATERAGKTIAEICLSMCRNKPVVQRLNRLSAEIAKLAINCFLTTKIAFANAVGDLANTAGADVSRILETVGTDTRIGGKYLRYGYGYGGSCLPRDNRSLALFAENNNCELVIGKATDAANKLHLQFQLKEMLAQHKPDETIVFNGVAFKEGSVLLEESQKLQLALELVKHGRKVLVKDQQAVLEELARLHPGVFKTEATA